MGGGEGTTVSRTERGGEEEVIKTTGNNDPFNQAKTRRKKV